MKKLTLCLLLGGLCGCASVMQGAYQNVPITTEPAKARVKIFDDQGQEVVSATTPYTAKLRRGNTYFQPANYTIIVFKEGYEPEELALRAHTSSWYSFGNLLLIPLSPIGYLGVDPSTGSMWSLEAQNNQTSNTIAYEKDNSGAVVIRLKESRRQLVESR